MVYGESDSLPGLVIDQFGSLLVARITTAGIKRVKIPVTAVLVKPLQFTVIVLRNDIAIHALDVLLLYTKGALDRAGSRALDQARRRLRRAAANNSEDRPALRLMR